MTYIASFSWPHFFHLTCVDEKDEGVTFAVQFSKRINCPDPDVCSVSERHCQNCFELQLTRHQGFGKISFVSHLSLCFTPHIRLSREATQTLKLTATAASETRDNL